MSIISPLERAGKTLRQNGSKMEIVQLKCLIATIVAVGFLLISSRPVVLLSILFVLYGLILLGRNEQKEMIAALALIIFGILFRRDSGSKAPPTVIDVTVNATEETAQSEGDEPITYLKVNTTSYLEVIRNAKREEEERIARQLEKWEQSRQHRMHA
jgi:hypothetical protein